MKLNLAIIVKDQVEQIKNILEQYSEYFDEVHIAVDKDFEKFSALNHPKLHIHTYIWKNDFADKRNFLASKMDCDYYFTIDTDDKILNPKEIRPLFERAVADKVDVVYGKYIYAKDQDGNTNAAHYKERLVRLAPEVKWNKPVHETIPTNGLYVAIDDKLIVEHQITHEHSIESQQRNLAILLSEYEKDKEKTDPRTVNYIAKTLYNLGLHDRAIFFYDLHIKNSGWDEDRMKSYCDLADIYRQKGEYEKAISCCMEAMLERYDYPDPYLRLHDVYVEMELWKKAIHWGEIGAKLNPPQNSMMLQDPSMYTWRAALSLSFCYFKTGEFEKAKALFDYASKLAPSISFIKEQAKVYEKAVYRKKFIEKFMWMYNQIKDYGSERVCSLLQSVPDEFNEHEIIIKLKSLHLPPVKHSDNSIVIFCGRTVEEWTPDSVVKGIGGSEEAVIHLSNELTKLGYDVTVYGNPGDKEGDYNGVKYYNFYKFNKNDEHNIVISWRNNIFPFGIKAKKKFIWLHDVPYTILSNKEDIKDFDKVIVLSEYHKSLLPSTVPNEKIFVSANGINLKDFEAYKDEKKNPKRIIYTSSYDRGIEHLIRNWKAVKEQVPDAELHLFYGWNTYDGLFKEGAVDGKFKQELVPLMKQEGIFEHGRVGHEEIIKEMSKSAIWAYPSHFQEISCISAMKAQAAGCIPVCTDYAALKETVKAGLVIPGNAADPSVYKTFQKVLISILKDEEEQEAIRKVVEKHRDSFGWDKVAKQWHEELFPLVVERKFIKDRFDWIKDKCKPTDKIVDIGGNDGHTFDNWNRDNVTTVDIDLYDIPNFVRSNAETLPFEDKKFDVAVLAEILEHVENPIKALQEAKRVAKKVIITVPEEHEWEEHLDPMMSIEDKEKKEGRSREVLAREGNPKCKEFYTADNLSHLWHNRHYTKETLEEHLKLAGYSNFKVEKLVLGKWVFYGAIENE